MPRDHPPRFFEESLRYAGVLGTSNNIIPVRDEGPDRDTDKRDEEPANDVRDDVDEGHRPGAVRVEVPVGDRKVVIHYPYDLTAAEATKGLGRCSPRSSRRIRDMEFVHTCYRITDPVRSIAFYEALGLEKRRELPIREEAMNYFLGVPGTDGPELELTHNFETPEAGYELGTAYGHIALTVDDLDATLERLAGEGIEPERPPYTVREGGSRLCFVRDPDGYRVELVEKR